MKKRSLLKRIFRFFIFLVSGFVLLAFSAIMLVFIYEDEVKGAVIRELNKHLKTEVLINPSNIDLTFISTFPQCAIEFRELTAMESWKKKDRDTLLHAGSLRLRFSLTDLFEKKYNIRRIDIRNCTASLKVDSKGKPNFEVWRQGAESAGSDSLSFSLENISVKNFRISYLNHQKKLTTEFKVSEMHFKGRFSETNYELSSEGAIRLNHLSLQKKTYLREKQVAFDVILNVQGADYQLKKAEFSVNRMRFAADGALRISDSLESAKLHFKGAELDISSLLSLLPEQQSKDLSEYRSSGTFYAEGDLNYAAGKKPELRSRFGIEKGSVEYLPAKVSVEQVDLKGELVVSGKESFLSLEQLHATMMGGTVSGAFVMRDFAEPDIDAHLNANLDLAEVIAFWPMDTIENLEGKLSLDAALKGSLKDIRKNAFSDKVTTQLQMKVSDLKVRFKKQEHEAAIESCEVIARERSIIIPELKLRKGSTDLVISGEVPGLFNYILDSRSPLIIRGKLHSNAMRLEDLIFSSESSSASEFSIPSGLALVLDASITSFSFGKFSASDISGNFELKNQKAMLSDMKFRTMEGEAELNILADASGKNLELSLQSRLKNINVRQLFAQMNNFGQSTLQDQHINGVLTAAIDFSGSWNRNLVADYKSIAAQSEISIERGELINFKPLESLARFVELNDLRNIRFSALSSRVEISNGLIQIPSTTIRNSALNLEFSGTHSFDNEIDYHIRLLLSELLAKKRKQDDEFGPVENDPENRRSAFIRMTGTVDKPVIRYDRQGLKQKIREDLKQEKQNLKELLRNEFGLFRKDSARANPRNESTRFELEKPDSPKKKTLELKKKEDEDDY